MGDCLSAADDLNASCTANQWLEQDLRAICALAGCSKYYEEWVVHVWRDSGLDYADARAAWELKAL
ncbi:hypothetical protein AB0E01_22735 [Nocardia vinacea]|uniref:hypothetical protein n=1 Tax=Nocardia vinacea TaxID=96468 RepID=UPI003409E44E